MSETRRPEEFVAMPKPTPEQLEILHDMLTDLEHNLWLATKDACRLDYDPEDGVYPAKAFATLCQLLTDFRYAKPVPKPAKSLPVITLPGPTVLGVPFLGVIDATTPPPPAKKPARRTPARTAKRFDFAALPPRVECGC